MHQNAPESTQNPQGYQVMSQPIPASAQPSPTPSVPPVPVQPPTPPQPKVDQTAPPIPEVPVAKNRMSFVMILVVILLVLLIGVGVVFAYMKMKPKSVTPVATNSPVPTATADPMASWKTYITPDGKGQVKYPIDWQLTSSSDVEWNQAGAPNFIVSKDGYQMVFTFPSAFGPGICGTECTSNFVEIKGLDGATYRRVVVENKGRPNQVSWAVYTKTTSGTWATYPLVNFYVPLTSDSTVMQTMDQILSTFKFITASPSASPSI